MLSSISTLYASQPTYFQRMLEFFLKPRFNTLRLFLIDKPGEHMLFTIDGTLIDFRDRTRRFNTFTDWYNAVYKTTYDCSYLGIFDKIHISKRVSIMCILKSISFVEYEKFQDVKYRSYKAYDRVIRLTRAKSIYSDWDKTPLRVEWHGHIYNMSYAQSCAQITSETGSVDQFLTTLCSPEPIYRLYCILTDGNKVLLSDKDIHDISSEIEILKDQMLGLAGITEQVKVLVEQVHELVAQNHTMKLTIGSMLSHINSLQMPAIATIPTMTYAPQYYAPGYYQ